MRELRLEVLIRLTEGRHPRVPRHVADGVVPQRLVVRLALRFLNARQPVEVVVKPGTIPIRPALKEVPAGLQLPEKDRRTLDSLASKKRRAGELAMKSSPPESATGRLPPLWQGQRPTPSVIR
jgi:hypothetical protein